MVIKRARLQISLASIFVIVSLSAVAASWYTTLRNARLARERYQSVLADYDFGIGDWSDVLDASRAVLSADLNVPFCSQRSAYGRQLARTRHLEEKIAGLPTTTMLDTLGAKEVDKALTEIRRERAKTEAMLR